MHKQQVPDASKDYLRSRILLSSVQGFLNVPADRDCQLLRINATRRSLTEFVSALQ